MQAVTQTAGYTWPWVNAESKLIPSTLSVFGLSLALTMLVYTIYNCTHLGVVLITVVTIVTSMINIAGIVTLLNWELGIPQCICLISAISLSVNSTLIIAKSYMKSPAHFRSEKMGLAYEQSAKTIINNGILNLLCAVPLIDRDFAVLNKFAVLLLTCTLFQVAGPLFLFGSICHIIGPQGFNKPIENSDDDEPESD